MKVAVDLEDAALFAMVAFDVGELLIQSFQLLNDLHSLGFRQSGGAASREAFKTADDGIKFGCIFFGERRDHHAALVRHPVLPNVAFLLELVERGANRSSADVKPFGEISFDDPGSGREFAMDDEFAKLLEGCKHTGSVRESGRAALGVIFGLARGHKGFL